MTNVLKLIRPDLQRFTPYSSARDEINTGTIWLNANESPFLQELDGIVLNRYPEKQPPALLDCLSTLFNRPPAELLITRGSDEPIDLLIRLFCQAGEDAILICPPTFGMYKVCARLQNAAVIEVPLIKQNDFAFDKTGIMAAKHLRPKLIFLCSPNNPTGTFINIKDVAEICEVYQDQSLIIVDEAYIDYTESEAALALLDAYDNVVILRTLSKFYGLAAIRLGILLGRPELIACLKQIIAPYPIAAPIAKLALAYLSTEQLKKKQEERQLIIRERKRVNEALTQLPIIKKCWPSAANFLLLELKDFQKSLLALRKNGIVLRNFPGQTLLQNCLRMTLGLPHENDAVIDTLSEVPC